MADLMTASPLIPKLMSGDRLTRDEFERRYDAMPELKKAELIEGVVYMASPVRHRHHSRPDRILQVWLGHYEEFTPGLDSGTNGSVRLDNDNVLQPDLFLRLPEHAGGRSRVGDADYIEGPPELVCEVAASSVSYDLHQKLHVYRRHGVREYLVHRVDDGVWRSRSFPGLWLSPAALLSEDLPGLRALVVRGCHTPEHAVFCERLRSL